MWYVCDFPVSFLTHKSLHRCSHTAECSAFQFQQTGPRNCVLIVLEQDAERFIAEEFIHIYKRGRINCHSLILK